MMIKKTKKGGAANVVNFSLKGKVALVTGGSHSIGLALGIIVFYNHIGGRRLTKDPTPIEVAMHNYEYDVDMALIELADREGVEEDVT